ncbi:MAG: histidine--tRNA ligase [Candidatus Cloacimonetes bacterium]|nr:histidine--tRNA ligase [Candidatus Cloacimonadota bacterium]
MKYKIPRGTYDILPEDSQFWYKLMNKFRELCRLYNYHEIVTPIFEQADLFERSVGDSSDIVEKEMYKFQDKKGRVFALRPEGTASVVRSFIENNLGRQSSITRVYYSGPMFRYDRPQKGRFRQFYQYGVEHFGSEDPFVDAEVISLANMFLTKLGLKNFRLELNSLGCRDCSPLYDQALVNYYSSLKTDLCPDCQQRLTKNPKRLLDCKVDSCRNYAREAPSILDYLDENCRRDFELVQKYLTDQGIEFIVNPRIVRGLDYYVKTAFEFTTDALGSQNTLCGGGRYDGLVEDLGGDKTPGIGFAGGFERLIEIMKIENIGFNESSEKSIYLVLLGDQARAQAAGILHELRTNGIKVDFDITKTSIKAQMKSADKAMTNYSLIIGDEELARKTVILKDMSTGEQQIIQKKELVSTLIPLVQQ